MEVSAPFRVSGAGGEQAQACPAIPAGVTAGEERHGIGSSAACVHESSGQRGQVRAGCCHQTSPRQTQSRRFKQQASLNLPPQ